MPSRLPVFWFYGRFVPPGDAFHVPKAFGIADRFGVNLMGDAFWIALPNRDGTPFDDLLREVELLASAFVGAYAMKTEAEMTAYVEAWVESRAADGLDSTVGIWRLGKIAAPGDQSTVLQALTDVDFAFRTSTHWRAALRDIGRATADHSDDAFLFAARSLECCARGVTGRVDNLRSGDWDALAARITMPPGDLQTLKNPLSDARNAVAHGEVDSPDLAFARANRADLLRRDRNLVRLAFGQSELAAIAAGTWTVPPDDPRQDA